MSEKPAPRPNRQALAVHCIDGQTCTAEQIAARLGITRRAVNRILSRERRKPGPITWTQLYAYAATPKEPTP